jgi:hypothetical protein
VPLGINRYLARIGVLGEPVSARFEVVNKAIDADEDGEPFVDVLNRDRDIVVGVLMDSFAECDGVESVGLVLENGGCGAAEGFLDESGVDLRRHTRFR